MNRPLKRWVRSLLVVPGNTIIAFAILGIPANAMAPVTGTIVAGRTGLSVRAGATTLAGRSGIFPTGMTVRIQCQVLGQRIGGRVRTTNRWNRLTDGRYVSDAFVRRTQSAPICPANAPATAPRTAAYTYGPVTGGTPLGRWLVPVSYRTIQGFRTPNRPNHDGEDMMAPRGTPIRATAAGRVVTVTCNSSINNCDVDGSAALAGCGWYIEILHAGNIVTRYCHMVRRPEVVVGQTIGVGQTLGFVGSSGRSSAPHLHYEVHLSYPATRANAVDPIDFMRRAKAPIAR